MATIKVNGVTHNVDVEPAMPLLWVLREKLSLLGSKFGCGQAQCGACTVLVDGSPTRACITAVSDVEEVEITTIEGLKQNGELHPVQKAWLEMQVPQCGYCQSGQILACVALLKGNPNPDAAAINEAFAGNLCRCGTYNAISAAVKRASELMGGNP